MDVAEARQHFSKTKFFPSLDGLRGLSIIPVVWHHAAGHQEGLLGKGYLGVQLFFAISGFLITTLLLREEDRAGTISLRNFYVRRTLRIFPAYYAAVLVYSGLVFVLDRQTAAGTLFWRNLPTYLTYTSNWFVDIFGGQRVIFYFAWSLATEEQFYLVWPSVVRFARRWWFPVAFMVALLAVSEAVNWGVSAAGRMARPLPLRMLGSIASPICLGSLLAYLTHRPAGFRVAWSLAGQWWSALLAAALLAITLAADAPELVVSLAMTCLVAAVTIRPDHALRRVLDTRALRYVGTISYGIYLFHMLAINFARRFLVPSSDPLLVFLLALPLAIAIATVSFRYFEARFTSLKQRFGDRAPEQATVPVEA